MRTTLDLPETLMRELKARAAQDGITLKNCIVRMVESHLHDSPINVSDAERSAVLVFKRKGAKPMPVMTNAELNGALDAQDTAKMPPD